MRLQPKTPKGLKYIAPSILAAAVAVGAFTVGITNIPGASAQDSVPTTPVIESITSTVTVVVSGQTLLYSVDIKLIPTAPPPDAGVPDVGFPDAGSVDADAGVADADPLDLGFPDAVADAGPPDLGPPDTGIVPDSGLVPDSGVVASSCVVPPTTRTIHYCPGGDDANPGTAALPKSSLIAFSQDISWGPGEATSFLFCRGGSWNSGARIFPSTATGHHHYVGAYGPVSSPKPVWNGTVDVSNGSDSDPALGNLTIQDIALRGSGPNTAGVFTYRAVDNFHICDMDIQGFGVGVQYAHWGTGPFSVRDSYIAGNSSGGFLGGGNDFSLVGNTFESNGYDTGTGLQGHNVYISAWADNMLVEGNTLLQNASAPGQPASCDTVSFVAHGGRQNNLRVINNHIEEPVGTAQQGCWGLTIDAASSGALGCINCEISGNKVMNVGNVAIGVQNVEGLIISNNEVVHNQAMPFGTYAISAPVRSPQPGAVPLSNVLIDGNKMDISDGSFCLDLDPSVLSASDNNDCTGGVWAPQGDLDTWRSITGFDWNSIHR